jgi:hypothetical protein
VKCAEPQKARRAFARVAAPPNKHSTFRRVNAVPLSFERRAQTPSPHHTVPIMRFTPDGLRPSAASHDDNLRSIKFTPRKSKAKGPSTVTYASGMCSRQNLVRRFLDCCAALNASVIYSLLYLARHRHVREVVWVEQQVLMHMRLFRLLVDLK